MVNINKYYIPKMREGWTEIYASKPIWQNNWVWFKTDVSRMFHEGDKGGWFTYVLW